MDLSSLTYAAGSVRNRKKVGRGGAHGKTSCRGQNGQRARAGAKRKRWFEGGQMPIMRRLPKRGFHNINRVDYQVVNVDDLNRLEDVTEVTPQVLKQAGLISGRKLPVKVLGNGELKLKLNVTANAFSKTAIEKIEAVGGKVTTL